MEKMTNYGAPQSITSFVIPTGYSFNLDGSTLYQSIAALFLAQLYGIDLSLTQQIVLILTLMVTSKGIAGVPGVRSEEHTSELQSLMRISYAVFCLKKKKNQT